MANTYDVQGPDGKLYEVQADSPEQAASAFAPAKPVAPPTMADAYLNQSAAIRAGSEAMTTGAVSGIPEGLKRLLGGAKQLAGNAEDFYTEFFQGKPAVTSPRFPNTQVSKGMEATANENERQLQSKIESEGDTVLGKPVNTSAREGFAKATELVGLSVVPEITGRAALGRSTTFFGNLGRQATYGELGAALQFDPANDKGTDYVIAGAAPIALGSALGAYSAFQNVIARSVARAIDSGSSEQIFQNAARAMPNFRATLAQRTGLPITRSLEGASYNNELQNFYRHQSDRIIVDFANRLSQPVNGTIEDAFASTRAFADGTITRLRTTASNAYELGITDAERLARAGETGGERVGSTNQNQFITDFVPSNRPTQTRIPVENLTQAFAPVAAFSGDRLATGGGKNVLPGGFVRAMGGVLDKGYMTAGELARTLRGLTQITRGDNPQQAALAGRLFGALNQDLDTLSSRGLQNADTATQQILQTRANYRAAQAEIDALGQTAAYRLLGVGGQADVTAEQLLGRFQGLSPARQGEARGFMEAHAQPLLAQMKQAAVNDAVQKAGRIGPASDSPQDIGRFVDALFDSKNGDMLRTHGLWSADELRSIGEVRDGLRVILNQPGPIAGRAGTALMPADVAPNLISRSAIFVARQAARWLTGSQGSRFFTDPNILEYITRIRHTDGTAQTVARTALLQYLHDNAPGVDQQNGGQ